MARYPHRILDSRSLYTSAFGNAQADFTEAAGGEDFTTYRKKKNVLPTGIGDWDHAAGGLRLGEVTEVCGALGGTSLLMDHLLAATKAAGWLGAWVDAGDSLEVEDWDPEALGRIVWMRCRDTGMALKGADLLLRDGNLSWVTLDLQTVSAKALRRISGQHWHRFHRLVELRGNALLVLTPSPMVEGAKVRVLSRASMKLASLHQPRCELQTSMAFEVFVKGRLPNGMSPKKTEPISLIPLSKSA
jgi:RecA/RadA recombinase